MKKKDKWFTMDKALPSLRCRSSLERELEMMAGGEKGGERLRERITRGEKRERRGQREKGREGGDDEYREAGAGDMG